MQDQTNLLLVVNLALAVCACAAFWLIRGGLRSAPRAQAQPTTKPTEPTAGPQELPSTPTIALAPGPTDEAQREVRADVWGDGANDIVRVLAVGIEANGYRLAEVQSTARQWLAVIESISLPSDPLGSIAVSDQGDRRIIELLFAQALPHPMTMLSSAAVGAGFRLANPDNSTPNEVVGFRGQSRLLAAESVTASGFSGQVTQSDRVMP